MDTLPVDREKGISYSTFTIAKVAFSDDKSFINVELVEYDNPESLRFVDNEPVEWDRTSTKLRRKTAVKEEIVHTSSFDMKMGDRLIFFSDGVAQSGLVLGSLPGVDTERIHSSAAHDDITCAVVSVRKPKRAMLVTGAPRSRESDKQLGAMIRNFDGRVIVCGGTTAKIVARELGKDVKADRSPSGNLPPASIIDGIELVTEGMLTLTEVSERLEEKVLLKQMPEDPAKRIIRILRDMDQLQIVMGTKINNDTDDPAAAAKIGVRFPVVDRITRALERSYLKEVEVTYL